MRQATTGNARTLPRRFPNSLQVTKIFVFVDYMYDYVRVQVHFHLKNFQAEEAGDK